MQCSKTNPQSLTHLNQQWRGAAGSWRFMVFGLQDSALLAMLDFLSKHFDVAFDARLSAVTREILWYSSVIESDPDPVELPSDIHKMLTNVCVMRVHSEWGRSSVHSLQSILSMRVVQRATLKSGMGDWSKLIQPTLMPSCPAGVTAQFIVNYPWTLMRNSNNIRKMSKFRRAIDKLHSVVQVCIKFKVEGDRRLDLNFGEGGSLQNGIAHFNMTLPELRFHQHYKCQCCGREGAHVIHSADIICAKCAGAVPQNQFPSMLANARTDEAVTESALIRHGLQRRIGDDYIAAMDVPIVMSDEKQYVMVHPMLQPVWYSLEQCMATLPLASQTLARWIIDGATFETGWISQDERCKPMLPVQDCRRILGPLSRSQSDLDMMHQFHSRWICAKYGDVSDCHRLVRLEFETAIHAIPRSNRQSVICDLMRNRVICNHWEDIPRECGQSGSPHILIPPNAHHRNDADISVFQRIHNLREWRNDAKEDDFVGSDCAKIHSDGMESHNLHIGDQRSFLIWFVYAIAIPVVIIDNVLQLTRALWKDKYRRIRSFLWKLNQSESDWTMRECVEWKIKLQNLFAQLGGSIDLSIVVQRAREKVIAPGDMVAMNRDRQLMVFSCHGVFSGCDPFPLQARPSDAWCHREFVCSDHLATTAKPGDPLVVSVIHMLLMRLCCENNVPFRQLLDGQFSWPTTLTNSVFSPQGKIMFKQHWKIPNIVDKLGRNDWGWRLVQNAFDLLQLQRIGFNTIKQRTPLPVGLQCACDGNCIFSIELPIDLWHHCWISKVYTTSHWYLWREDETQNVDVLPQATDHFICPYCAVFCDWSRHLVRNICAMADIKPEKTTKDLVETPKSCLRLWIHRLLREVLTDLQ